MTLKSIIVASVIAAASLSLAGCVGGGSYYADNSYGGYYPQDDVFYGGYGNGGFYRGPNGYFNRGRGGWDSRYVGRTNHSGDRGRTIMYGSGNRSYRSGGGYRGQGGVFVPSQGKAIGEGR